MVATIIGGRYKILRGLSRGAFGETYLAEDLESQQTAVVKKLKPLVSDEYTLEVAKRLFTKEAETLKRLGVHPQIPTLLAFYPEQLCIVQEYVEGTSLSEEIGQGNCLQEAAATKLLKEVLEILEFIHKEDVIHRDIKPSNLIRRKSDGKLVLIDFGAVKELSTLETNFQGQTVVTVAIGTPVYMPMEQQQGKPKKNSDIYALGIMAIQALTGKTPTELMEDKRSCREILQKDRQVSLKLAMIIDKMVRADWKDRYQSAQEVLNDLARWNAPVPLWNILIKGGVTVALTVTAVVLFPYTKAIYVLNKANAQVEMGQYRKAIELYDQVLDVLPKSAKVWFLKGYALSQEKRFQDQLQACEQAIELKPDFVEALNCRALALNGLGKYPEALKDYDRIIELRSDFYQAYNNKGESFLKLQQPQKALDAFDQAILYNPDYVIAWTGRGDALFQLQRYPEAIPAYSKAIELSPKYSYAWNGRGNAYRMSRQFTNAVSDYKTAIQTDPESDFYEAHYNLALAHIALKQCQEAVAALDRAIEIKPNYQAAIQLRENLINKGCS
jgi:tetratricopeptide (TPR) repeat protein/tRNA A-37 threonylcarbamoyl transferase component Bud32